MLLGPPAMPSWEDGSLEGCCRVRQVRAHEGEAPGGASGPLSLVTGGAVTAHAQLALRAET